MGLIRSGPPEDLVLLIRDASGAEVFVETGTYLGQTALWAAKHFDRVVTIERSPEFHASATKACREAGNVQLILGDSRSALADIAKGSQVPIVFWLDAHWSGGKTSGRDHECPLVDELLALKRAESEALILIDDARLFLSPPPLPHDIQAWPELTSVLAHLSSLQGGPRYTVVIEDVIVSVPRRYEIVVSRYCQERSTENWRRGYSLRRLFSRLTRLY